MFSKTFNEKVESLFTVPSRASAPTNYSSPNTRYTRNNSTPFSSGISNRSRKRISLAMMELAAGWKPYRAAFGGYLDAAYNYIVGHNCWDSFYTSWRFFDRFVALGGSTSIDERGRVVFIDFFCSVDSLYVDSLCLYNSIPVDSLETYHPSLTFERPQNIRAITHSPQPHWHYIVQPSEEEANHLCLCALHPWDVLSTTHSPQPHWHCI